MAFVSNLNCMTHTCRIATAWAGDSRMVLGRQRTNEDGQSFLEAVELTEDHKPDNPGECRRINEAGGRVDRLVSGDSSHPPDDAQDRLLWRDKTCPACT